MIWRVGVVGIVTILVGVFCYINYDAIMQTSRLTLVTGNAAPSPQLLQEALSGAREPGQAVVTLWETRGIPHRQAAIGFLREQAMAQPGLLDQAQAIGAEALRDPDIDVQREALLMMRHIGERQVWAILPDQLRDADPQVRELWLEYLVAENSPRTASLVAAHIDDPDPQVQALAVNTLARWAGESFTIAEHADAAARQAAIKAARAWWADHRSSDTPSSVSSSEWMAVSLPSVDFQLDDTEGRPVVLSSFFGRPVLLQFWVTADPTCRRMAAELTRLRTQISAGDLAIVSVALDGVAHDAAGAARYRADDDGTLPFDEQLRLPIAAAAQAEGINYPVLIENTGRIAGAYEGFAAPVTVWIDADGQIRRRLTGFRSAEVLEKMYQQVRRPISAPASAALLN